jgi:hypothetical protein
MAIVGALSIATLALEGCAFMVTRDAVRVPSRSVGDSTGNEAARTESTVGSVEHSAPLQRPEAEIRRRSVGSSYVLAGSSRWLKLLNQGESTCHSQHVG